MQCIRKSKFPFTYTRATPSRVLLRVCTVLFSRLPTEALLSLCGSFDSEFSAIVSTSTAYGVVDVGCSTVGANCDCRQFCYIVSTTLRCSGVRLSSFRMCHVFYYLLVYYTIIFPQASGKAIRLLFSSSDCEQR